MSIQTKLDHKICIFGISGSGKTNCAKNLAKFVYPKVVAFDVMGDYEDLDFHIVDNLQDLVAAAKQNIPKITFKCDLDAVESFPGFCKVMYEIGNYVVFVEEADEYKPIHKFHKRLIQRGRHRGIGLVHVTPRPQGLDPYIKGNTHEAYLFTLLFKRDVEYVASWLGDQAELVKKLPKYHFLYWRYPDSLALHKPMKQVI